MNNFNSMLDKLANFVAAEKPDQKARAELLAAIVQCRDDGWREAVEDKINEIHEEVRGCASYGDLSETNRVLERLEMNLAAKEE